MNHNEIASRLKVKLNGISEMQLEQYKVLYDQDKSSLFSMIKKEENWRQIFLDLYVYLAERTFNHYKYLEIDETIFFDTLSDIPIWAEHCQNKTGINGIEEYDWISRSIDLKLFKLGRLQFEPIAAQDEIYLHNKNIEKSSILLNVHIQAGEKLYYDQVQSSYKEAIKFFRGISRTFICKSWLLSPNLKGFLSERSNIIRFQQDYEIAKVSPESRQFEERVFGICSDFLENYPENTTLQRKGKEYLLNGGVIGEAVGVIQWDFE